MKLIDQSVTHYATVAVEISEESRQIEGPK